MFWLLISEIFPLTVSGAAMSISTVGNWTSNVFRVPETKDRTLEEIGRDFGAQTEGSGPGGELALSGGRRG